MKTVSRFEANLVHLVRFFLRWEPPEQALPVVINPCERPPCLSRAAVELVQDSLAKGCPLLLARAGGWRRERFLRNDQVRAGRLWERTPPADLGLAFSGHALSFLMWMTATQLPAKRFWRTPPSKELGSGDRLLFYLAYAALRSTAVGPMLRSQPLFLEHVLCRLMFPEDFADAPAEPAPDFVTWTNGPGAFMLEVLQAELALRWQEVERGKGFIQEPQAMRGLGHAQEQVLTGLFQAVETTGRFDLARFLLPTLAGLLRGNASSPDWVGGLKTTGLRLADRLETNRAALVLLREAERLGEWERRARGVGYFDEGYAASQLWKADWERWRGDDLYARAQPILREVDPLRM